MHLRRRPRRRRRRRAGGHQCGWSLGFWLGLALSLPCELWAVGLCRREAGGGTAEPRRRGDWWLWLASGASGHGQPNYLHGNGGACRRFAPLVVSRTPLGSAYGPATHGPPDPDGLLLHGLAAADAGSGLLAWENL